jgi:molybdopterin/thiamine biosynthesis adenylyltransferase/proteasome lid subunit RPN8/RPN11
MAHRYTITFLEEDYNTLQEFLFSDHSVERAAILRCRTSVTTNETRLLVRSVHPFEDEALYYATDQNVSIKSTAFMPLLGAAASNQEVIAFVHSHPKGYAFFSEQDDRTEPPFFDATFKRIEGSSVHASLIFANPSTFVGRVWLASGKTSSLDVMRVIGHRWQFLRSRPVELEHIDLFDRQVRVFGKELQEVLSQLHVGIVGLGGTGSATAEQVIRLGVGTLSVWDDQLFEASNINRVYNSRLSDTSQPKVDILRRTIHDAGLGTNLRTFQSRITQESVAKELRDCDIVLGCTDDHLGRAVLNSLALYYLIPVIDMGVAIHSQQGQISSIFGRATTLMPRNTCLNCRQRISPDLARFEGSSTQEQERIIHMGYAPELGEPAPAVITFTTSTAALAVNEMLQRLTGFMGIDHMAGEVLYDFFNRRLSTNDGTPRPECPCQRKLFWGAGDRNLFLDMTWP